MKDKDKALMEMAPASWLIKSVWFLIDVFFIAKVIVIGYHYATKLEILTELLQNDTTTIFLFFEMFACQLE